MKKTLFLLSTITLASCASNVSTNDKYKEVEKTEQGVTIQIPKDWSFDDYDLIDLDENRKGVLHHGAIEPDPYVDCQELMNRHVNGGEDMHTDKGSFGFIGSYEDFGGDVFHENFRSETVNINGRKVFRTTSDYTSYGEPSEGNESGEYKGIYCWYCVELSNTKLGLFDFYPANKNEINLGDTIVSTMKLIK